MWETSEGVYGLMTFWFLLPNKNQNKKSPNDLFHWMPNLVLAQTQQLILSQPMRMCLLQGTSYKNQEMFPRTQFMSEYSIAINFAWIPVRGGIVPLRHRWRVEPQNLPQQVKLNLAWAEHQTVVSHQQQDRTAVWSVCDPAQCFCTHCWIQSLWWHHSDLSEPQRIPLVFCLL